MAIESIGTPELWVGFTLFVVAALMIDLGVFHRHPHAVSVRTALKATAAWVSLALIFNAGIYYWFGTEKALEFLTGYLIEEALSVDNLFVFLVVFSYFSVPAELQHRVLFWGVLGAIVLRGIFILAGAALLQNFHWIFYVFAAFLIFTGVKLLYQPEAEVHPEQNLVLRAFRSVVPAVPNYRGTSFLVVDGGRRKATPLLMVLIVIEATDLVFAVDSVPAIFGVTSDPFIVYTSNIFAILGLRSLFFALAAIMGRFHYLKIGLGLVLVFVGVKMLIQDWYKIPIGVSLGVVVSLLGGSVVASLLKPPPPPPGAPPPRELPGGQREEDFADEPAAKSSAG